MERYPSASKKHCKHDRDPRALEEVMYMLRNVEDAGKDKLSGEGITLSPLPCFQSTWENKHTNSSTRLMQINIVTNIVNTRGANARNI